MKFYNRENEIKRLQEIQALSLENAQFILYGPTYSSRNSRLH
jgi:AAA+ ATPase superfamily predicted ATPase